MQNTDPENKASRPDVELIVSDDGSHTLFVPQLNEHYHSTFGALNESVHVYIHMGLQQIDKSRVKVLEVGFGTGLNALLTARFSAGKTIVYHTCEKYPLEPSVWEKLNYGNFEGFGLNNFFRQMHMCVWETLVTLANNFQIKKIKGDFRHLEIDTGYDLVYFDAFGPDKQPDLWCDDVFRKIFEAMGPSAVLVTYCAKGSVRRMLASSGFMVERLPGPPGKKEMLRAIKP
ncbi:MAG: tRNA (5-methylaminomethyl-2-thiouridine)(34)-methyltransferase MnmD [Breznakibacter sp.]